ncbi:hypothetical protein [Bartonella sp. AU55XJBT]|uniref:hypothetical protein n=1 Tax=Bartonella sp. AU55XJBT TaxID=3019091 RepID=UPI00235F30B6|nr:hypothetical protein [Bartonella sp. AU55XJBT]
MMLWLKKNLLLTGAALAAFFMALAKAFTLGKKQIEKTLKAETTRLEVENEVNQKRDSDVRTTLSRWLRNK